MAITISEGIPEIENSKMSESSAHVHIPVKVFTGIRSLVLEV